MGLTADVVIDIDPGGHRTGITPGQPALALAQLIDQLPGLRLLGLLCYDGGSQHVKGFTARRLQTLERLLAATETFDLFNRNGLSTEIFSGGVPGATTSTMKPAANGHSGRQLCLYGRTVHGHRQQDNDAQYADFEPALTVLTTVLNDQYPGRCTTDAGQKPARSIAPGRE